MSNEYTPLPKTLEGQIERLREQLLDTVYQCRRDMEYGKDAYFGEIAEELERDLFGKYPKQAQPEDIGLRWDLRSLSYKIAD